jgi:hypothetical protein
MEDLRLWFLESRIRLLWSGISDRSWSDFLTDESGKNRKALKELLDNPASDKVGVLQSRSRNILTRVRHSRSSSTIQPPTR